MGIPTDAQLEQRVARPLVRARLGFSRLAKTGWQFDSTVELSFAAFDDGEQEPAMQRVSEEGATQLRRWTDELRVLVQQANQIGRTEVSRLSALDELGEQLP